MVRLGEDDCFGLGGALRFYIPTIQRPPVEYGRPYHIMAAELIRFGDRGPGFQAGANHGPIGSIQIPPDASALHRYVCSRPGLRYFI